MTDYKLVPVEPTAEMLCKGMEAYCIEDCEVIAQGHVLGIYKAMLSATPAVQGEPENWREKVADLIKVAHGEGQKSATGRDPSSFRWVNSKSYKAAQALLAAPTPEAVQGEPVGWVWHSYNQTNFTSGSHHKEVLEADGVKLTPVYTAPQPAEQQPAPDVAVLEAAKDLLLWWAHNLSNCKPEEMYEVVRVGYSRIVNLANVLSDGSVAVKEPANER